MNFEDTIKRISAICASFIMFFIAFGIYLSAKGFSIDENNNITLRKTADAAVIKEVETANVASSDINLSDPVFLGEKDAPITIYEYSSFGCYHCADFHIYTLPQLKKDFIDTGKVKLIFVDFPLEKKSMQAALLSHCIAKENYFEFLNILFKNQKEWSLSFGSEKVFTKYASLFGLTSKEAIECMKNEALQNEILSNRQLAIEEFKIQGTPAFVIKKGDKKEILHGAPDYKTFKETIEKMLEEK